MRAKATNIRSTAEPFYLNRLLSEFHARRGRNSSYSMRAFSKHLALTPATLSRILDRKRVPSLETVERITDRLGLKPADRRAFIRSSVESYLQREVAPLSPTVEVTEIDIDGFHIISDWYHYAILELTFVDGFQSDANWIARRLSISIDEANVAIRRLLRLNLLSEEKDAKGQSQWVKTGEKITTKDKLLTSTFHRKFQAQILSQALSSLEHDTIEERSITSLTVAIDPNQLPIARAMIQEFTRNLCDVLESGTQKRVYQMGIALYPIDRGTSHADAD